ncbi:MAG: hypothetical protein ACRCY4_04025 [Brevinema sp.]
MPSAWTRKIFLLVLAWWGLFPVGSYAMISRHNFRLEFMGGMSFIGDYTTSIDDLYIKTGEWFASTIPLPSTIFIGGTTSIELGYTYINLNKAYPLTADFSVGVRGISFPKEWVRDTFSFTPYMSAGMGIATFHPRDITVLFDIFYTGIGTTHNLRDVKRIGLTLMVGLPLGFRLILPSGFEIGIRHELELSLVLDGLTILDFTSFPNIANAGILRYNLLLTIGWFYGHKHEEAWQRR